MIIGICGKIGSGKDTVASIVQELYPDMNWQIKGFADKLREVASLLTGIPASEMKRQEIKEQFLPSEWNKTATLEDGAQVGASMTLRYFLQKLGTDAIRDGLHSNAWVNALMCDYKAVVSYQSGATPSQQINIHPNWLVTDCRFPNEMNAILSKKGMCIRVVRPNNPHPSSNHPSETSLDHIELTTIVNDGSIEQLRENVQKVFDPIVHWIRSGDTCVH